MTASIERLWIFQIILFGFPAVVFYWIFYGKKELKNLFKIPKKSQLLLAPLTAVFASLFVAWVMGYLNQKFPAFHSEVTQSLQKNLTWQNPVWIITLGFIPAFCEEMLFRGALHEALSKKGEKIAWIGTNLLFGLSHFHFYLFPIYFLIGIFFSYWRVRTQGLCGPILAHLAFNLTGTILILLGV